MCCFCIPFHHYNCAPDVQLYIYMRVSNKQYLYSTWMYLLENFNIGVLFWHICSTLLYTVQLLFTSGIYERTITMIN